MSLALAAALTTHTVFMGGLTPSLAPVDRIEVTATIGVATGVSLTGGGDRVWVNRSPSMLNIEIGLIHPSLPWLEISPTLMIELERRVGFGVAPKGRMFLLAGRLRPFVLLALPVFIAPYKLLGTQGGIGLEARIHRRFGVAVDGTATAFVLGDDLLRDHVFTKLDVNVSLRGYF